MGVYLGSIPVGVIVEVKNDDDVYKYHGLVNVLSNGGPLTADSDYIEVYEYLQRIYKILMGGGNV